MAVFEFKYTEIDGLLYPNIEIDGKAELDGLGALKLKNIITVWRNKYVKCSTKSRIAI